MASPESGEGKWSKLGHVTSTPTGGKKGKEVKLDDYYVVVGFEVNVPAAFVGDVHDLAVDYGHAFFYVVKNLLVEKLFSFGPSGMGKVGWFNQGSNESPNWANRGALVKNGFQNSRPGTPDYGIGETVSAFKIPLTLELGPKLVRETDKKRAEVISGRQRYTAYANDTCASKARDVLSAAGVSTPSGSGIVKHSGLGLATGQYVDTIIGRYIVGWTAVNPYMWHKNFKSTSYLSGTYSPPTPEWTPAIGAADPIF
jgi:hypothetical protein